ncbi:HepT-like ribonuclease domain-containing protein [Nitrospirillum sp. BR 11164]|uniref:HepT-like ribonuclease domain-containing protein n=1 Tax=Nitrospirillum sp. BR 11164 TaxID=3104324 RepID=UPI002B000A51|nr:HepT-like ribonuclease domain-containing protein [Nitrospirillum sp. BR 11164]MEA1650219.1 HepT-like ribonuclease domain-containing protein [Nitrospirillum sp. BR 11164]
MADATSVDTLLDILELINRIERQVAVLDRQAFLDDMDVQDATAYRILAIGEASKDLGEDLKARHPQVPWRQVVGMRNLLAHEYFMRESAILWETVKAGLPALAEVCRAELAKAGWRPADQRTPAP